MIDRSCIGKTYRIVGDLVDDGNEAVLLDYNETLGVCDIKVLLPNNQRKIRKISRGCLEEPHTDNDQNNIFVKEKAPNDMELDVRLAKIMIKALELYVTERSRVKNW